MSDPGVKHKRQYSPVKKRRRTDKRSAAAEPEAVTSVPLCDETPRKYIGRFWTHGPLRNMQHYLLMEEMAEFFTDDVLRRYLLPLLSPAEGGTGEISRRVMDWFVVNYSKKWPVMYRWEAKPGWVEEVNVFKNYELHMKKYQKHSLDVFCRGKQRVFFQLDGRIMQSAVAQLNFVRWAVMYGVYEQLLQRYAEVTADHHENMSKSRQQRKQAESMGKHKKRASLSTAGAVQSMLRDEPFIVRYV